VKNDDKGEPVRLQISSFWESTERLSVNGFVFHDDEFDKIVRRIEVYGNRSAEITLMMKSGNLVNFRVISAKNSRTKQFGIGRLIHEGWTTFSDKQQPKLQHISTIEVVKFTTERSYDTPDKKRFLSYVYANAITGWPTGGVFGLSYEGTITKRKYRNGLESLVRTNSFSASADFNYHFEQSENTLIRHRLCSITIFPHFAECDVERAVAATRISLSFVYEENLRPLRKVVVDGSLYRTVDFPQDKIKFSKRGIHETAISIGDQKAFTSRMIRWLYQSELKLDHVEYAISRYIAASRELPLEVSFSAGCEALESLFTAVRQPKISTNSTEKQIVRRLRRGLRQFDLDRHSMEMASQRIGSIFSVPKWNLIKAYIKSRSSFFSEEELDRLEECNFFKYRNLSSHGMKIAADGEVSRQNVLMRITFQMLLPAIIGSRARLTLPSIFDLSRVEDTGRPHFVEIWE
jgi:hypothetical protein